ncbi:MAG: adenylosuccinate lyase [Christensenellales bacterium]|jgi:adenylosuccinate lyase
MSDRYVNPLCERYASYEMQNIFSADKKFSTWRRLWIALAKAEKELGLDITDEQISQMEANVDNIDYDIVREKEREIRHDVMAHIYEYGLKCPDARPIIHLGATSCYVGDNTDIIVMKEALLLVHRKLVNVIALLSGFAAEYKDLPALAYTHLQPAQLTTVGKRASLWINELMMDLEEVELRISSLKFLGCKGTTGTQASFMELFAGDTEKVKRLDKLIAKGMGFDDVVPVSGQTYSRKVDAQILSTLSGVAQSASKFSNDMRILQNFKEMEEPFEESQVGSSAMPYKRNPMRSERITSLSRHVIIGCLNPAFTAATQWFERTLDDSANKRIAVAEAFLAVDSILDIMNNICSGLVVYPNVIHKRVMAELPFMASENIMMDAVKRGGDRQALHEKIREHAMAAGRRVKQEGLENDLMDRICADPAFGLSKEAAIALLEPSLYTGRSGQQVEEFLSLYVNPVLKKHKDILGEKAELNV